MNSGSYQSIATTFQNFIEYYYRGKHSSLLKIYNKELVKFYSEAKNNILYNVIITSSMQELMDSQLNNYVDRSDIGKRDEFVKFLKKNKILLLLVNLGVDYVELEYNDFVAKYAKKSQAYRGFLATLKFDRYEPNIICMNELHDIAKVETFISKVGAVSV